MSWEHIFNMSYDFMRSEDSFSNCAINTDYTFNEGKLTGFYIKAVQYDQTLFTIDYNSDNVLSVMSSIMDQKVRYYSPNEDQVIPLLNNIICNGEQCMFFVYRNMTPENLTDEHRDILASIMCRYDDFCGTTSSWENWIMVDSHVFVLRPLSISTLICAKHEESGNTVYIESNCIQDTISYLQKAIQDCVEKSEKPEKKTSNQELYALIEGIDSRLNKIETILKTILEVMNDG